MQIQDILQNEKLRLEEFPVAARSAYFAHAGVCPLPRRVAAAMTEYLQRGTERDQEAAASLAMVQETKSVAAKLLRATPEEIALVGPTSLALSFIAGGLRFRKHDNILVYHDDYPSNVYPWMKLADRGVQVRLLNARSLGQIRAVDVIGQVDEQTRVVALASCHYIAGFKLEIDKIGKALRERGILFALDAIQTLGAFPTTVEYVDFLAADSHKWMLGPCAAGILYVRKEVQEKLQPIVQGWHNLRSPDFVAQEELEFKSDARRYEAGTHNFVGMFGMKAAMEMLLELGIDNIAAELTRKRKWLLPALQEKGYTVLYAHAPAENQGGITTFFKSGANMAEIHATLEAANIATSLRTDRTGQKYIRLSPHFYNTDAELQKLIDAV
ncbi:MAG: Aminotransferase class [Verrucomicrobiales bacterium]|nr:Aminotransferase class [Verrucomicrobiales bacterium]